MGQQLFQEKYTIAEDYQGNDDYNEATFRVLMALARRELPAYAEETLQTDNKNLYAELRSDIENSQWNEKNFPDENFALILEIIQDPRFLKTRNGWAFLLIFDFEREKITSSQKTVLLRILQKIYDKFDDWMPCFSVSELVGEHFEAPQIYAFFQQFATSDNEIARAFVPHGYEHALQNSTDAALTSKLWRSLLKMEHDTAEQVRVEVEESLFRLANRGLQRPT